MARATVFAWVAAVVHGAEATPSWRQTVAKSGDGAMLADGLSGGTIGCVTTGITGEGGPRAPGG